MAIFVLNQFYERGFGNKRGHWSECRIQLKAKWIHPRTMFQNNQISRLQYWAAHSSVCLFACTTHSLALLTRSAALAHSLARQIVNDYMAIFPVFSSILDHSASLIVDTWHAGHGRGFQRRTINGPRIINCLGIHEPIGFKKRGNIISGLLTSNC